MGDPSIRRRSYLPVCNASWITCLEHLKAMQSGQRSEVWVRRNYPNSTQHSMAVPNNRVDGAMSTKMSDSCRSMDNHPDLAIRASIQGAVLVEKVRPLTSRNYTGKRANETNRAVLCEGELTPVLKITHTVMSMERGSHF